VWRSIFGVEAALARQTHHVRIGNEFGWWRGQGKDSSEPVLGHGYDHPMTPPIDAPPSGVLSAATAKGEYEDQRFS